MITDLVLLCSLLAIASTPALGQTATASGGMPDLGPNVHVFDPSMPDMQSRLDAIFATQESAEFGPGRHALLFKPGTYNLDVRVGFYTHVAGLGMSPDDVVITGAVRSTAEWKNGNATCNFWRGMENLAIKPTRGDNTNVWAVSQATFMRRVRVMGDIALWDGGWSSGGFIADSRIDGTVNSGSQQQWFSRNADWGKWDGGNWNMVFVGATNPPAGTWPERPYTVIDATPVVREKPYLVWSGESLAVAAPRLKTDARGTSWGGSSTLAEADLLPLSSFHIARAGTDRAESINAALAQGKNVLLTPGVYDIEAPIKVGRAGTIVLGLGLATLAPTGGWAAMDVADVEGVHIAGVIMEAPEAGTASLLTIGAPGSSASHRQNPIVLSDITCRNGGARAGKADCLLTINSNDVIVDNIWLWRADHGIGAKWDLNYSRNGLIVNGNDVTCYGLFNEHHQEYQTIWNGERGRVYFYQSEMPYDPPSQEAWMSRSGTGNSGTGNSGTGNSSSGRPVRGFASYKVADHVKEHRAWGVGVYCVFKDAAVIADTAIEAPEVPGVQLKNLVTIRLSGLPGSGIARVLNDRGDPVIDSKKAVLD